MASMVVQDPTVKSQRVAVCIDNRAGLEILRYLNIRPDTEVICVITHPKEVALYYKEIKEFCLGNGVDHLDVNEAKADFGRVARQRPDIVLSVYFDYILDDRFLDLPTRCAINLHPGYLPYNRGFYYYVWAVLDGTPAGVSLHKMERTADSGAIISQMRVIIEPNDTADIIYRRHEDAAIKLCKATWTSILSGDYRSYAQPHAGTRHKLSEFRELEMLDPYKATTAKAVVDRVRLLTNGRNGRCGITLDGKTYRLSLVMEEETPPFGNGMPRHPGGPAE